MKFYYVYVLQNSSKNFIYIGYSEDVKTRFKMHNSSQVTSTKAYTPLELIHYEAYRNMTDAKRREMYLKSNKGRTTLITIKNIFLNKACKLDKAKPLFAYSANAMHYTMRSIFPSARAKYIES